MKRTKIETTRAPVEARANDDELDVLWGAEEIGKYLRLKPSQVYHLTYKRKLPVKQLSRRMLCARKSDLAAWLSRSAQA